MIVISVYNDIEIVKNFLVSLEKTNNLDEKILLVCSCPKQTKMLEFLNGIKNNSPYNFNFDFTVTPYSGYEVGSFIWSYKNFTDEYYIFLQDSLLINSSGWLDKFKEFRDEYTVNAWCSFKLNDEKLHTDFFFPKMGFIPKSLNGGIGIFGNIFQISRSSLNKINEKFNLDNFIPSNKLEDCSMERGWSYLSIYSDLKINCIDGNYSRDSSFYKDKLITKLFNNRE